MDRHEASARHAQLRVALGGWNAGDELDPGPDAAGVLPAAARPAEPFPEECPGEHQAPLRFLQGPGQRHRLAGGPHADADQRAEQVGADGEARALGDVVDAGADLQAAARPDDAGKQVRKALPRPLDAGRDDPGRDHRRLEEAEVVLGEVEHVAQRGDVGGGPKIHGREPEHRFLEHPQPGADRRARGGIASVHAEVDRDVQHLRALGEIHAEEEDVGPRGVGQVHAQRRLLAQDGEGPVGGLLEQFRTDPQRLVGGMSHAEHPLVATHRADAAAHLVGQRLEGEAVVGRGQGRAEPVGRPVRLLVAEKGVDRLLEPPAEELLEPVERDEGLGAAGTQPAGQMEPVDRGEQEERPDPLIEVFRAAPERLERLAGRPQFLQRSSRGPGIERPVADGGILGGDQFDKRMCGHDRTPSRSASPRSTSTAAGTGFPRRLRHASPHGAHP